MFCLLGITLWMCFLPVPAVTMKHMCPSELRFDPLLANADLTLASATDLTFFDGNVARLCAAYAAALASVPYFLSPRCYGWLAEQLGDCNTVDLRLSQADFWYGQAARSKPGSCRRLHNHPCDEVCASRPSSTVVAKRTHWSEVRMDFEQSLQVGGPLPQGKTLRVARSGAMARKLLQREGAFALPPNIVDAELLARLDTWLLTSARELPSFPVRRPWRRTHALLLPEDGPVHGDVAAVVAAIVHGLGSAVSLDEKLTELAAFVVESGAEAQELHADVVGAGFLSCQLALHDSAEGAGGLALWLGSALDERFALGRYMDAEGRLGAGRGPVEVAPLRSGSVVCYDGRTWHRGSGHVGGAPRRTIYFTVKRAGTRESAPLGEAALHPSLRCAPLRSAPLLSLGAFAALNLTSFWERAAKFSPCDSFSDF